MIIALVFTFGSFAIFAAVAGCASFIAKRHHYYEDPDEDKSGRHHDDHGHELTVEQAHVRDYGISR